MITLKEKQKLLRVIVSVIVTVCLVFGAVSNSKAAITKEISYQGKLTNGSGVVVPDAAYNIKLTLYDAVSGGNCVWTARGTCGTPTAKSISTVSGIFNTLLGESGDNTLNLDFSASYWLGVTVGSDAEMSPRKKIGATPYSFNSLNLIGNGYLDVDNIDTTHDASNINYNPASGTYSASSIVYGSGGGTGTALRVQQSGTGKILELFDSTTSVMSVIDGGNVGIGTTAPGALLEITKNGSPTLRITNTAYANKFYDFNIVDSGGLYLKDGNGDKNVLFGDDGSIAVGSGFAVGNNAPDNGMIIEGNVGIGTIDPRVNLEVTATTGSTIRLQTTTEAITNYADLQFKTGAGIWSSQTAIGLIRSQITQADPSALQSQLEFYTNSGDSLGTAKMVIDKNGNVGIGATVPYQKLEVQGGNIAITTDTTGAVGLGQALNFNSVRGQNYSKVRVGVYDDIGGSYNRGNLAFMLDNTADSSNADINDTVLYLQRSGNVGIGTTSPVYKLTVEGTGNDAANVFAVRNSIGAAAPYLIVNTGNSAADYQAGRPGFDGYVLALGTRGGAGNYKSLAAAGQVVLATEIGNVGIGTTSPGGKLEVYSTGANQIKLTGQATGYGLWTDTNGVRLGNWSGTSAMVVNSAGNVGIGTTSPGAKLEVNGQVNALSSLFVRGDVVTWPAGKGLEMWYATSNTRSQIQSYDRTGGAWENLAISAKGIALENNGGNTTITGGNVGIGTTSPAVKLHLYNSTGDTGLRIETATNGGSAALTFYDNSLYRWGIGTNQLSTGSALEFRASSGNDVMVINQSGNVGIGTTNPSSGNLQVNGRTYTTTLTMTNGASAGYYLTTDASGNASWSDISSSGGAWTLTGSNLYPDSTSYNVGIGTTGPTSKLEIFDTQPTLTIHANQTSNSSVTGTLLFTNITSSNYNLAKIESYRELYANSGQLAFSTYEGGVGFHEAMRINTYGKVGIGTTSPNGLLHLNQTPGALQTTPTLAFGDGDSGIFEASDDNFRISIAGTDMWKFSNPYFGSSIATYPTLLGEAPSATNPVFSFVGDEDTGMSSAGANILSLITGGVNGLNVNNGNVGIGTTAPGAKLQVANGNIAIQNGNQTSGDYSQAQALQFYQETGASGAEIKAVREAWGSYPFALTFSTHSTSSLAEAMRITSGGNVGIGTTAPAQMFYLWKNANSVAELGIENPNTGNAAYSRMLLQTNASSAFIDNYGSGYTTNGAYQAGAMQIGANGTGGINIAASDAAGLLRLFTGGYADANERMRITQGGNVGIGTTAPVGLLDVRKASVGGNLDEYLMNTDNTNVSSGSRIINFVGGASAGDPLYVLGAYATQYWHLGMDNSDGDRLEIGTGSVIGEAKVTIKTDGNVGIGTTNPLGKLDIRRTGTDTIPALGVYGGSLGVTVGSGHGLLVGGLATGDVFQQVQRIDGTATAYNMLLQPSGGNVGIGTTNPASMLDIYSSTSNALQFQRSSANTYNFQIGGSTFGLYDQTNLVYRWQVNGTNVLLAPTNGNVGIGTTNPSSGNLQVNGRTYTTTLTMTNGASAGYYLTTDASGNASWSDISSSGGAWTLTGSNLYPDSTSYNVGIGTTAPGAKLAVDTSVLIGRPGGTGPGDAVLYLGPYTNATTYAASLRYNDTTANLDITPRSGYSTIFTSGNVGIGTTAPTQALLSVAGNIAATQNITLRGAGLTAGYYGRVAHDDNNMTLSTSGGTGHILLSPAGNVGIGTTSPSNTLHVIGSIRDTTGYYVTGAGSMIVGTDSNDIRLTSVGDLELGANSTITMFLQSGGNVGIGTTAPVSTLQVSTPTNDAITEGLTVGSSATSGLHAYFDNSGQTNAIFSNGYDSATAKMTFRMRDTGTDVNAVTILGNGNVGIGTTNPSSGNLQVNGRTYTTTLTMTNGASAGYYLTTDASGNASWSDISSSGGAWTLTGSNLYPDSTSYNVGIGTTGPTSKLEIFDTQPTLTIHANQTSNSSVTGTLLFTNITSSNYNLAKIESYRELYANSGQLAFSTYEGGVGFHEAMRINTYGKVGIGTTSPNGLLHLNQTPGALQTTPTLAFGDGDSGIFEASDDNFRISIAGTDMWKFSNPYFGSSIATYPTLLGEAPSATNPVFSFVGDEDTGMSSAGANILSLITGGVNGLNVNNGNVGIGTTSPGAPLAVEKTGTGGIRIASFISPATTGMDLGLYIMARNDVNGLTANHIDSVNAANTVTKPLYINASGANTIFGGNVGIGTTSPGSKLTIYDSGNAGVISFKRGGVTETGDISYSNDNAHGALFVGNSQYDLYLRTNGSSRMFINSSGNVGIGTVSPTMNLVVNGAQEIYGYNNNYTYTSFANGLYISPTNTASPTEGLGFWTSNQGHTMIGNVYDSASARLYFNMRASSASNGITAMTILGSGNVGIGTIAPGKLFDVRGDAQFGSSSTVGTIYFGVGSNEYITSTDAGGNGFKFYQDGYAGYQILRQNSATTDPAHIFSSVTNGNEYMRITQGGNVGIGTTSPGTLLNVYSLSTGNPDVLRLQSAWGAAADGASLQYRINNGTDNWTLARIKTANQSGYGGQLIFEVNAGAGSPVDTTTERMRIDKNGNVGIGTTSPQAYLEVANSAGPWIRLNDTDANSGAIEQLGNDLYLSTSSSAGIIYFKNNHTGSTRPSGSGDTMMVINDGNVGIGTTNPVTKLDVRSSFWLGSSGSAGIYMSPSGSRFSTTVAFMETQGTGIPFAINTNEAQPLIFGTNSSERIRITSAGNVGIGTTNPLYSLQISNATADIRLVSTAGTNRSNIQFANTGGTVYLGQESSTGGGIITGASPYAAVFGHGGAYPLQLATNNAVAMTILSGGNVGIGTTSPGAKLEVSSTAGTLLKLTNTTNSDFYNFIANASPGLTLTVGGTTAMTFDRSSNNIVMVPTAGNVGIGTTNPNAKLTVNGNLSFGERNVVTHYIGHTAGNVFGGNSAWQAFATDGADEWITFGTLRNGISGGERVRIDPSGSVGIGTTSPGGKLEVYDTGNPKLYVTTATAGGAPAITLKGAGNTNTPYMEWQLIPSSTDQASYMTANYNGATAVTNILVLKGNGNVGIGTTAPSGKLEVYSNSSSLSPHIISTNDLGIMSKLYTGRSGLASISGKTILENISGNEILLNPSGGNIGIGTTSPGQKLDVVSSIRTDSHMYIWDGSNNKVDMTYSASKGLINMYDNNNAQTVLIHTGGNSYFNGGNVGIGTTSPQVKLDVVGNSVYFSPDTAGKNTFMFTTGTANYGWMSIKADTTTAIKFNSNGDSYFNGGNVGIGTTTPQGKLDVGGVTGNYGQVGILSDSNSKALNLEENSGGESWQLGISSAGDLGFMDSNSAFSSSSVVIQDGGNVGIGTTSPGFMLTVVGAISSQEQFVIAGGSNRIVNNYGDADINWTTSGSNPDIYIRTNSAERMRITNGGNVGIGSTAPLSALDVATGMIYSHNTNGNASYGMTSAGSLYGAIGATTKTGTGGWGLGTMTSPGNASAMTPALSWTGDGYVGIGTTTPTSKLYVSGGYGGSTTKTYGGIDVWGKKGSYSGINFFDGSGTYESTLMVDADGATGMYIEGTGWQWYFSGGSLAVGTVPCASITGNGVGCSDVYVNTSGDTMTGNLQMSASGAIFLNGGTSYGVGVGTNGGNSAILDTINSTAGDTLELNYLAGTDVRIGDGSGQHNLHVDSGGLSVGYNVDLTAGYGVFAGNLGIGTTGPAVKLQIDGGMVYSPNTSGNASYGMTSLGSLYGAIGATTKTGTGGWALGTMTSPGNASAMTPVLSWTGDGNVGIGTTNPTVKLEVVGDVQSSPSTSTSQSIFFPNNGNHRGYIGKENSSGNYVFSSVPAYSLVISNYGETAPIMLGHNSPEVTILNGGYVGIGTTLPQGKLDVGGVTGNYGQVGILSDSTGKALNLEENSGGESWQLGINSAGDLGFMDSNSAFSSSSVVIQDGGNVGIGTTDIGTNLEVDGANQVLSGIGNTQLILRDTATQAKDTGGSIIFSGALNYAGIKGGKWNSTGGNYASYLAFFTRANGVAGLAEQMRIDPSGNVGIGTTGPAVKLQIDGGMVYSPNTPGNASYGMTSAGSLYGAIGATTKTGTGGWGLGTMTSPGNASAMTPALSWTGDGYVGIGTTVPTYLLDVNGNARATDIYTHDGGVHSYSDKNLKNVEGSFSRGLDEIASLNPVYFRYKDNSKLGITDDQEVIGVMAQDVQKLIPEAVGSQNGYLTLTQGPIFYTMINAIKELNLKQISQKTEITSLNSLSKNTDSEISDINFEITEKYSILTGQINTLEERIENDPYQMQIAGLEDKVNSLEEKIASLQNPASQAQTITQTKEITFQEFETTDYITSTLTNLQASNNTLSGDCTTPDAYNEITINPPGMDVSGYDIQDGHLIYNLYIEDPASITDFATELGNQRDTKEVQWNTANHQILQSGWNEIRLNISEGIKTGEIDWTSLNYMRVYFKLSGISEVKIGDVKLEVTETINKVADVNSESVDQVISESVNQMNSQQTLINQLQSQLADIKAQTDANTSLLLALNPKTLIYLDPSGNLTLPEATVTAKSVEAEVVKTKSIVLGSSDQRTDSGQVADPSSGSAVIKAGDDKVIINTTQATQNAKIFVTLTGSSGGESIYVNKDDIDDGKSFTVRLDGEPYKDDIKFNWLIIH